MERSGPQHAGPTETFGVRPLIAIAAALFVFGSASSASAAVESYTIGVDGMACPFCAYGIEKKLKEIEGVQSLEIRIKEDEVDVVAAEEETPTPSDLERAIQKAGFEIRSLSVSGRASIERSGGSARATFSEDFALRIAEYHGDTGEFDVRGSLERSGPDGAWRLTELERVE